MRQGGKVAVSLGLFVVALIGVGYGTRVVGPMVGGALDSFQQDRAAEVALDATALVEDVEAGSSGEEVAASPAVEPVAPGPDPEFLAGLDGLADQVASALRGYGPVEDAFDPSAGACEDLQAAYIDVQDTWFEYSVNGTGRLGAPLDPTRSARDKTLYADVQQVELSFVESGCPRP